MNKKILLLIKTNLINDYGLEKLLKNLKSNENSSRVKAFGMALVVLIAVASITGVITIQYWVMTDVLAAIGGLDMMLIMTALFGSAVTFFVSFYKAPGYLYASKDFGMLVSLPLHPRSILFGKLVTLYLTTLIPGLAVSLPGLIIYGIKSGSGALFYICGGVMLMALPIIPMLAGSLIAFPVSYIGARFRFSNMIILFIYLILTIAIVVGSYALPLISAEQFESGVITISGISKYYFPASLFAKALHNRDIISGIVSVILPVCLLFLSAKGFAKVYRRINAAINEKYARSRYKLRQVSVSSPMGALIAKELKNYFSSYIYVMNTAIGMVMFLIYIIAMGIFGYESVAAALEIPGGSGIYIGVTALVCAFCIGLSGVSAASVSMEGESLWIIKSLPIRFKDIAGAKIIVNLLVTAPITVIGLTIFAFVVTSGLAVYAGMTLVMLLFCVFAASLGLLVNLHFPKLEWKNPVQAVKQSASVLLTMIINGAVAALLGLGFVLSGLDMTTYFYLAAAAIAVLTCVVWLFLSLAGKRLFDAL